MTFGAATKGQEIVDAFESEIKNKTFLITGANTGLGLETARCLASKPGSQVVFTSRNAENGRKALEKIKNQFPDADVTCLSLDLGSLASIESFAKEFGSKFSRLNVLINNAGVMACTKACWYLTNSPKQRMDSKLSLESATSDTST